MRSVKVHLADHRDYPIVIGQNRLQELPLFLDQCLQQKEKKRRAVLVFVDEKVKSQGFELINILSGRGFEIHSMIIPSGESSKSLAQLSTIYDFCAEKSLTRQTVVITLGGGVVGDLGGFVAATYNRGMDFIQIPTTLLAMVDSSVGGKVGINHSGGKNLIGAFHQPRGVWIDLNYLETLPQREFLSGLAEVVKYGVILDESFFVYLEKNSQSIIAKENNILQDIIQRSCELKAEVVKNDEHELTGLRMILNYGHTFAHAFETISNYGELLHGEAVSIGMIVASRFAQMRGYISEEVTQRQIRLLQTFNLPVKPKKEWETDQLIRIMKRDKKSTVGQLRLILPTRIGEVKLFSDIEEREVKEVLQVR